VPLVTHDGLGVGTLCVLDYEPRSLSAAQTSALAVLGRQVMTLLELRRAVAQRDSIAAALAENEARYRALFESGQGLICTHDLTGRLLSVNTSGAAALGYEPEDMIGRNLAEFMPEPARAHLPEHLAQITTESVVSGRLWVVTRDGHTRVLLYRNRLYSDGTNTYVLGHGLDDTDRVRAEDELRVAKDAAEQANRAKSDVLATMSHDIRFVSKPVSFDALTEKLQQWGTRARVNGQWPMSSGQWSVVSGQWSVVSGQWSVVNGQWSMVNGQWSMVNGY